MQVENASQAQLPCHARCRSNLCVSFHGFLMFPVTNLQKHLPSPNFQPFQTWLVQRRHCMWSHPPWRTINYQPIEVWESWFSIGYVWIYGSFFEVPKKGALKNKHGEKHDAFWQKYSSMIDGCCWPNGSNTGIPRATKPLDPVVGRSRLQSGSSS